MDIDLNNNDPNPPQSLAEIIQERMAAEADTALRQQHTTARYRQASLRGAAAGVMAAILALIIFLLKFGI